MRPIQKVAPLVNAMLKSPNRYSNRNDYAYFLYEDTISFYGSSRGFGEYHVLLARNARRFDTEEMLRMEFMREELTSAENL